MGSTVEKDETPHQVTLSSYSIGKYEVTVGQYKAYCTATGTPMPDAPQWGWNDKHPMVNVNYNDAVAYCNWLGEEYGGDWRLPTEAQWEFAAKGGNNSKGYTLSGGNDLDELAWYANNAGGKTQSVGLKKPNELGIYDMSGNGAMIGMELMKVLQNKIPREQVADQTVFCAAAAGTPLLRIAT